MSDIDSSSTKQTSSGNSGSNNNGMFMFLGLIVAGALIAASILYTGGVFGGKNTSNAPTPNIANNPSEPVSEVEGNDQREKMTTLVSSIGLNPQEFNSCLDSDAVKTEIKHDEDDALKYGATGTPSFFVGKSSGQEIDAQLIVGAQDISVFEEVIDGWLSNGQPVDVPGRADPNLQKISLDDDPILGDPNAELTMVEFSDYECPFCQRHYKQSFDTINDKYIKTGKLKLVYRDQIFHQAHDPNATLAALGANCAREQGGDEAYYKFHDMYFEKTLSNGGGL